MSLKHNFNQWLLLASVVFALFPSCQKEQSDCPLDLPCATQTGAHTFGCYVNGKPWVANIAPYVWDPTVHKIHSYYDETGYRKYYGNVFHLSATKVDSMAHELWSFNFWPVSNTTTVLRHENLSYLGVLALLKSNETGKNRGYHLDTLSHYRIEFTKLDTIKHTASGIFEMTMISEGKADTIQVTDGRFDVRYYPE